MITAKQARDFYMQCNNEKASIIMNIIELKIRERCLEQKHTLSYAMEHRDVATIVIEKLTDLEYRVDCQRDRHSDDYILTIGW